MSQAQSSKPAENQLSPVKTARDKFPRFSANRISMKWFGLMHVLDKDRKATTEEVVDHLVYHANNLAGKGQFSKTYGNLEVALGMCTDSAKGFEIRKKMILTLGLSGGLEKVLRLDVALNQLSNIRDLEIKAEKILSSGGNTAEAKETFNNASRRASVLAKQLSGTVVVAAFRDYAVSLSKKGDDLKSDFNSVQE